MTEAPAPARRGLRPIYFAPVALFAALAVAFAIGLGRDPSKLPSALIDRPVPEFSLPAVKGSTLGLADTDLKGEVSLVNVFASWCTACLAEHPLLMKLAADKVVPVHGLDYKDKPDDAEKWLNKYGSPYTRTGADLNGRVGIDWGVYGVPETFVIDRRGRIRYKYVGPLTPTIIAEKVVPLVRELRQ